MTPETGFLRGSVVDNQVFVKKRVYLVEYVSPA